MNKQYQIKPHSLSVADKDSVAFHVKSADYFGTMATIISLWKDNGKIPDQDFQDLYNDLIDLQNNYEIKKKLS